jgi:hypothetical protein
MMNVAAIDRILHHAAIIKIQGESYRKMQSLKNNPLFQSKPVRIVDAGHARQKP